MVCLCFQYSASVPAVPQTRVVDSELSFAATLVVEEMHSGVTVRLRVLSAFFFD